MLRATGAILLPEFLPPTLRGQSTARPADTTTSGEVDVSKLIEDLVARGENDLHARVVTAVERILFDLVLHATNGHLGKAAERLGLNRSTLRYKLRDTGLSAENPHAE